MTNFEMTQTRKAEILRQRARLLAKESEKIKEDAEHLEIVEFLLAHERYGMELIHIREVYPLKKMTRVPCTPPFVLGIINFRGQILSIIDIKKFFDLPERENTEQKRVIVLCSEEMEFGMLTDEILGVKSVPLSDIQTSVETLNGIRAEYLRGITEDRLIILNGAKILSDKNIVVHEEV